jgi:hypothetical protein
MLTPVIRQFVQYRTQIHKYSHTHNRVLEGFNVSRNHILKNHRSVLRSRIMWRRAVEERPSTASSGSTLGGTMTSFQKRQEACAGSKPGPRQTPTKIRKASQELPDPQKTDDDRFANNVGMAVLSQLRRHIKSRQFRLYRLRRVQVLVAPVSICRNGSIAVDYDLFVNPAGPVVGQKR